MQKASHLQRKWRDMVFFLIALAVSATDQLSKTWIRTNLVVGQSIPETGFFQITHARNTGAAFGLFYGQSFALTIVALVGITAILLYALFTHRHFPFLDNILSKSALGLVLGGTVGNLIDRFRQGHVTDFIDVGIWPVFNLADSAIVIGVIIFAYSFFSSVRARKH